LVFLVLCPLVAFGETSDLRGTVVDPEGRPVAGARVSVTTSSPGASAVTTDEKGAFRLEVTPSTSQIVLEVESRGFAPYRQTLSTNDNPVTVQLELAAFQREIFVTAGIPEMSPVQLVGGDELRQRQEDDLGEAFRRQPGLDAVRRGPLNLEPSVRGLQENQVAMLVDGTRTFAAGPARMDSDLSHVNPGDVRTVRVVKGPYALTWGAGALSSVQVETFRPGFSMAEDPQWHGNLAFGYRDSSEAADAHGGVWFSGESFWASVSAGWREGSDYDAGDGSSVPGDFKSAEGRASLGLKLGDNAQLEFSGSVQGQDDIDYPGRLLDATYFNTRSFSLAYRRQGSGSSLRETYAQVYSNRKDHRMNNEGKPTAQPHPNRIPPFALRVDLPTESNTTGARFYADLEAGTWTWRLGGDAYRSEQTATRRVFRRADGVMLQEDRLIFEDIVWPDAEITDLGAFARGLRQVGDWQLGTALRVDFVDASAGEVSDFFRANTSGDLDQDESQVSAALTAQRQLRDNWSVTVGLGRAVRTATVLERYSDRFPASKFQIAAEFMGNPTLDPEESFEVDLGTQAVLGSIHLDVGVFYRFIDEYITVAGDPSLPRRLPLSPPLVYRYINGDRATFFGGEVAARQQITDAFDWWANLSYVRGEDETFDEPVLGLAPLTGRAGLRWRSPQRKLSVSAEAKVVDDQDRVATQRFEQATPGYEIFDLRASLEVTEQLRLRLAVENLGDEAYAEHLNSPNPFTRQRILEPGRTVAAGVEIRF